MKSLTPFHPLGGLLLFALLVGALSPLVAQEIPEVEHPRPGYTLVDDMWLPDAVVYGDGVYTATAWPNGVVPYSFASSVNANNQARVLEAFAEIEACCQARFVPWVGSSSLNFILIRQNPASNSVSNSEVGMIGGPQLLNVGANHWDDKYVLVHELLHALGFLHEQSRVDRNAYVEIHPQHISLTACEGSCAHNFDLVIGSIPTGAYDFLSIMHYGQNAFSWTGQPTITCRPQYSQYQNLMGNRTYMTSLDARAMATRYGNPSSPTVTSISPTSVQAGSAGFTLTVNGTGFFSGSPNSDGVQGTRVKWNGSFLDTTWVDKNTVTAFVSYSLLTSTGNVSVNVENDPDAGWTSSFAFFNITAPPCAGTNDRVGNAAAGLGDVDGDGYDDYVIGAPGNNGSNGRVWCYSGRTGAVLWTIAGGTDYQMGFSLANAGDINRDGADDVLVGAPQYSSWRGLVRVINGRTGNIIRTVFGVANSTNEFGWSVSSVGDINADGVPDFIVGSPAWNNEGKADVFSGATGGLFWSFRASSPQSGSRYGSSVGGGYDLNNNGSPDAIVGAPWYDGANGQDSGRAEIWSAGPGSRIATREGDAPYDYFGWSVAMCSSTKSNNSGGHALVGAPDFGSIFASGGGTGYVRVFGSLGLLGLPTLNTFYGTTVGDRFGHEVAGAGDLDDDGYTDIIIGVIQDGIGAGAAVGPGYVQIRSGNTGQVLHQRDGTSQGDEYGWTVALAGDVNRDAVLDYIVGEPFGDIPCQSAGSYQVLHPRQAPDRYKVMITEVVTGNPAGVEITNFSTQTVNLDSWNIRLKSGLLNATSVGLNATIAPGEIIVVKEPAGSFPEVPAGTQVLNQLPNSTTTWAGMAVALVHRNGNVIDEVHIGRADTGVYGEGNLGGRFVGSVHHPQPGPIYGPYQVERTWGLDSNSGGDWYGGGVRSMGLENRGVGERGTDPRGGVKWVINEIDDSPDYIELKNVSGRGFMDLQGWSLLCSAGQNLPHTELRPFPNPTLVFAGGYVVIGDTATLPAELPTGVPYRNVATTGGNIPFLSGELSCALYDHFGRVMDVVRATRVGTELVHNHPRAPAPPDAFGYAAVRDGSNGGSFGRNGFGSDNNTGLDFRPQLARSMGRSNDCVGLGCLQTWQPDPRRQMDVRLSGTALGGGLTLIINAGEEHAGETWSFLVSFGHLFGTGPLFGLGQDAFLNWQILSVTPPWFGSLDARGSARLDVPPGALPSGVESDDLFILQDPVTGALTLYTKVLQWDT